MEEIDSWTHNRVVAAGFAVAYWVPYQAINPASPGIFENFSTDARETGSAASRAVNWPFDIRELFAERREVISSRLAGATLTRFHPIPIGSLPAIVELGTFPFNVVMSNDATVGEVSKILQGAGPSWLHISSSPADGATEYSRVNDETFLDFLRRVAAASRQTSYGKIFDEFLHSKPRSWQPLALDRRRSLTERTRANEGALDAVRVSLQPSVPTDLSLPAPPTIDLRAVAQMRLGLLEPYGLPNHADDVTLCVETAAWGLSRNDFRQSTIYGHNLSRREADAIYALSLSSGYDAEFETNTWSRNRASALVEGRDAEREALNAALLLHSGTRLTPVLRLPPGMSRARSLLLEIGNCARGNGPHQEFKLNKLGRRLGTFFGSMVEPNEISDVCGSGRRIGEISLISDLPLEWMSIDDVPLAMKHDVSRIPFTPGIALMEQCANSDVTYISDESLSEVLVIRSFRKGDPIAGHLENAFGADFGTPDAPIAKVTFVDVQTPDEFVAAVQGFNGSLLIFDGHGARDAYTGVGSVIVGGRPLDVVGIRDRVRLPPIVLLSACDTFPIDGGHGSAAAAMLALGARTVLGTLLPISSRRSCLFLARLLWRLAGLLPLEMKLKPHGVNWRFMMSGMLRMFYASELIFSFARAMRLSVEQRSMIQLQANTNINYRNPRWYEQLQEGLSKAADMPLAMVKVYSREYGWITDSMKYVQLGRPELIHVIKPGPLTERS